MAALRTRLRHLWLAVQLLPGGLASAQQRQLLAEMRQLSRELPVILRHPIPQAMAELEVMREELAVSPPLRNQNPPPR